MKQKHTRARTDNKNSRTEASNNGEYLIDIEPYNGLTHLFIILLLLFASAMNYTAHLETERNIKK